ncbi:MAG: transcriptional regulator [Rickettsiales bacterium]|nr:transcriptional regulator [Rickettsiales bacterium]
MKITDIITRNNIFLDFTSLSKKALFKNIAEKVNKQTDANQNEILDKLNHREKLGSTNLGDGIAIPHAKINGITKIFSLFIRTENLIDFSSSDKKGVDLIFVIIAPEESKTEHLLALSTISKFLRVEKNITKLRKLKTSEAIFNLFLKSSAS